MLNKITPHLLYQFKSESELVSAIAELSENFTKNRSQLSHYLSDPRLVSAYTAFYFTTNYPKLAASLNWLSSIEREELNSYQLIDVGAGPGTLSLAWREIFNSSPIMLESSPLMREQASNLFKALYQEEACFDISKAQERKLLLFSHSLNEMGAAAGIDYVEQVKPQKVWLMEPGTKESFKVALEFRDQLIRKGFSLIFPCPSSSRCPMQGSEDWCHQYLKVTHDPEVERLTQLAQKDRRSLPMVVMMFEKSHGSMEKDQARIVRVFPETKFSFEWQVCLSDNNQLQLVNFQLLFKSLTKEQKKLISQWRAGEKISYEIEKEMRDSHRIKLRIDKSE
jgi:ribosomal protein RSM22 (predicted rRNA methylase)